MAQSLPSMSAAKLSPPHSLFLWQLVHSALFEELFTQSVVHKVSRIWAVSLCEILQRSEDWRGGSRTFRNYSLQKLFSAQLLGCFLLVFFLLSFILDNILRCFKIKNEIKINTDTKISFPYPSTFSVKCFVSCFYICFLLLHNKFNHSLTDGNVGCFQ